MTARRTPTTTEGRLNMQIPETLDRTARRVFQEMRHRDVENYGDFLVAAVIVDVERLEREHNGGRPWPAVTAAQMRHAARRRGRKTGVVRKIIATYPGAATASRIRGTAVGLKRPLNELCADAIEARVRAASQTGTGGSHEA